MMPAIPQSESLARTEAYQRVPLVEDAAPAGIGGRRSRRRDLIEVLLDGELTFRGERRSETTKIASFLSASAAAFECRIPLGYDVEDDKVDARFKNGVLTAILPKNRARWPKRSA